MPDSCLFRTASVYKPVWLSCLIAPTEGSALIWVSLAGARVLNPTTPVHGGAERCSIADVMGTKKHVRFSLQTRLSQTLRDQFHSDGPQVTVQ